MVPVKAYTSCRAVGGIVLVGYVAFVRRARLHASLPTMVHYNFFIFFSVLLCGYVFVVVCFVSSVSILPGRSGNAFGHGG